MVSNLDWAKALDVDSERLEELQQSGPPDVPLIALAFEHGLVMEATYLAWARSHFELSSLKDEFFSSGKSLTEITTPGGLEPWNPYFVPVYEWDGIVFVGCLEPQFLPADGFQLVLCGAEALKSHYQSLAQMPAAQAVPELPPLPSTPPPSTETAIPDFNLDFSTLETSTDKDVEAETVVPMSTPPPPPTSQDVPPLFEEGEMEAPASLEFSFDVPPTPAFDTPSVPAPPLHEAESPPPPAGTMAENPGKENLDPWSEELFQQLDKYFDAKMIITKMEEGFAPRFWSAHWNPKNKSCPFINVKEANIFHIAHKTKRPFHGPISPNEVNDAFFEFWTQKKYPQQITVQPILKENDVIGMIVGIPRNTESQYKKLKLISRVSCDAATQVAQPAA